MTTPTDTPRPTGGRINIACGNFITGARWEAPNQQLAAIQYALNKLGLHLFNGDTKGTHTTQIFLAYDADEQGETPTVNYGPPPDPTAELHDKVKLLDAFHERITTRLQLIEKRLDIADRRLENAERQLATDFTARRAHLHYLERLDARTTATENDLNRLSDIITGMKPALLQLNETLSVLPELTKQLKEIDERMHDHIRAQHNRG